jgi:transcription antitermination factor NusG
MDEVRYVTGVSSLVRFGQGIPVIEEAIIADLRRCFESEEPLDAVDPLCAGAEVTVGHGAFLGFNGVVVRLMPARQRVQVLLDFLGRATLTEIDRGSLILQNRSMADLVPVLANPLRESIAV